MNSDALWRHTFVLQIVRTLSHEYTVKGDATLVFTVEGSSATVEHVVRHDGGAS
jgi:hypothetical protein